MELICGTQKSSELALPYSFCLFSGDPRQCGYVFAGEEVLMCWVLGAVTYGILHLSRVDEVYFWHESSEQN